LISDVSSLSLQRDIISYFVVNSNTLHNMIWQSLKKYGKINS